MMERKKFRYEPYPNILLTNYHQERLENGLSFYYYQDTELPLNSAGIYLVVKVGSLYEVQNESGFSHFLEHLLVRAGIDQAQVNSFRNISGSHDEHETKFDHTIFGFLAQSQPEISDAIKLLGTMSTKVSLRKEHLDAERDIIILEDMGSLENSNKRNGLIVESQICNKDIKELCTAGHFQEMLLGSSISEDQINSFYKKWYHLSNMGLIVVGNCNLKNWLDAEVLEFGLLEEEVKVGAYEKINERKHQVSEFRRVEFSRIAILKDEFVNHFLYNDMITDSFNVLTLAEEKLVADDRQATQRRVANYKEESWNCVISRLFPSEFTNNNVAFLLSRDPPIGGSGSGSSSGSDGSGGGSDNRSTESE
ncbi:hypothetical protein OROMI_023637 [Orobanche minor]